MAKIENFSQIQ